MLQGHYAQKQDSKTFVCTRFTHLRWSAGIQRQNKKRPGDPSARIRPDTFSSAFYEGASCLTATSLCHEATWINVTPSVTGLPRSSAFVFLHFPGTALLSSCCNVSCCQGRRNKSKGSVVCVESVGPNRYAHARKFASPTLRLSPKRPMDHHAARKSRWDIFLKNWEK